MRIGLVVLMLLMIAAAYAGVLFIEHDAPTIRVTYLQGVERATVYYTNHEVYRYNMTLMSGPNQCFVIGASGNDRAILITSQSDDIGPHRPDAIVDCRICGCEDQPNMRFTCRPDGRCIPCDPCSTTTCNDGEVCVREGCESAICTCDSIRCSGSTCEERVLVANRCKNERCIVERTCVTGACGSECTSGRTTTRDYCDADIHMRERTSCTDQCQSRVETRIIEDCMQQDCPIGTLPRCTSEGCACV